MDREKEVIKKFDQIQELAKENKNIDVAALMMNALQESKREEVDAKKKRWAYLISVGLPPFGLLMAARYYFSDKADGRRVALVCVTLTAVSLLLTWAIGAMMMASLGPQINQIQGIKPEDIKALLQ